MFYTIYKLTNKVNGKIYIGSHKTNDLGDGYMGSGKYLNYAIKKHGLENFIKEILFVFDNPEDMYRKEAELVNEEFLAEENTYNLKVGGFGGFDHINKNTELRVAKNKRARKSTDMILYEKYGITNPGQLERTRNSARERAKQFHKNGKMFPPSFEGRIHKESSKKSIGEKNSIRQHGIGNSQFGTEWITNGTENRKIRKGTEYPMGFRKGRTYPL